MGRTLLALVLLGLPSVASGNPPTLAPIFQDSMVLQQGVPIAIWGTADAGTPITATLADQREQTQADSAGQWIVKLASLKASTQPRELTVRAGEQKWIIRDVLIGEVWVAAGQSNMEWPLANEAHAQVEVPAATDPALRLLNLTYAGQNFFARPFSADVLKRLTPKEFYRGNWHRCSPVTAKNFSAIGYYFGKELRRSLQVPVGIINLAVGGSPIEAWIRRGALAEDAILAPRVRGNWLDNDRLEPWCRMRGRENLKDVLTGASESPKDEFGPNHPFKPGFLWEAGIAPLIPFSIRGVIWYQGESNSLSLPQVKQHEQLFPRLVADCRTQWGIGEFPFLYCQLSSIGTEKGYKSQYWPEFRDGQRRMLTEIPNTSMAVTSDVGHPSDVHPRNKQVVGYRLAWAARARVYGQKVAFSGPLAKSVQRDGAALIVRFDHADGGLKAANDKPPRSFEIAGRDGVFVAADPVLGTDTVTLRSNRVTHPVSVRYGWQSNSEGNLINGASLPASTFQLRIDSN